MKNSTNKLDQTSYSQGIVDVVNFAYGTFDSDEIFKIYSHDEDLAYFLISKLEKMIKNSWGSETSTDVFLEWFKYLDEENRETFLNYLYKRKEVNNG